MGFAVPVYIITRLKTRQALRPTQPTRWSLSNWSVQSAWLPGSLAQARSPSPLMLGFWKILLYNWQGLPGGHMATFVSPASILVMLQPSMLLYFRHYKSRFTSCWKAMQKTSVLKGKKYVIWCLFFCSVPPSNILTYRGFFHSICIIIIQSTFCQHYLSPSHSIIHKIFYTHFL